MEFACASLDSLPMTAHNGLAKEAAATMARVMTAFVFAMEASY